MTEPDIDLRALDVVDRGPFSGPICGIGMILIDPNRPKMAQSLRELMADPEISGRTIAARLHAAGSPVIYETVKRHMRGDCSCQKRGIA